MHLLSLKLIPYKNKHIKSSSIKV